ncbi:hypothetical protein [uncultured Brachyspira sp.]|uniref:hypothetical protein n=1 Tax=uncultured Brachyspira sp. TaxID=221953 RepID=UPI00262593AE|nr:hypothetical protein [uncultured Brachyspira sp.]
MKEKLKLLFKRLLLFCGGFFLIVIILGIIVTALDSDDNTDASDESMTVNTVEKSSKKWDENYNAFREDVNFLSLNTLFKDIDSYEISQALRTSSTEELHSKMESYALLGNFQEAVYYAELCYYTEVDYLQKAKYQLYCYNYVINAIVISYNEANYNPKMKKALETAGIYFTQKAYSFMNELNLPKSFYENDKVLKEFKRILDKNLK